MTPRPISINQRTSIITGGAEISSLVIRAGTSITEDAADGPPVMAVDIPPTIYPGGDMSPKVALNHEELAGSTLGPTDSKVQQIEVDEKCSRLGNNGVLGKAMGVFIDSTSDVVCFEHRAATTRLWTDNTDEDIVA